MRLGGAGCAVCQRASTYDLAHIHVTSALVTSLINQALRRSDESAIF